MYVAAYLVGLACGLVFLLPTVRRMRSARAASEAARALERSTQVELCVARERHANEVAGLRRAQDDELNGLRGRFGLEVRMLREAVSSARADLTARTASSGSSRRSPRPWSASSASCAASTGARASSAVGGGCPRVRRLG